MTKLMTIEEHNEMMCKLMSSVTNRTGVECPQCKRELIKTGILYTSAPPKQQITCMNCNYIGSML